MEEITSRKNPYIRHLRDLTRDADYRRQAGEFIGDSPKLLEEAISCGAEITSVLWRIKNRPDPGSDRRDENGKNGGNNKNSNCDRDGKCGGDCQTAASCAFPESMTGIIQDNTGIKQHAIKQYTAPDELFDYASPMVNSPGPVFTARIREQDTVTPIRNAIVLESVQDPGNIGTVIRTANAFGIGAVILTGECADLYSPKTVRSTMGALFRQRVIRTDNAHLLSLLDQHGLSLYGAVLSDRAEDILRTDLTGGCAVAVGNEGRGLSAEFRALCKGELIIPMEPHSESLNAAVAASVIMWEMRGRK